MLIFVLPFTFPDADRRVRLIHRPASFSFFLLLFRGALSPCNILIKWSYKLRLAG